MTTRAPRTRPDFTPDLTTVDGLVRQGRFYLHRAANTASECMQDHLQEEPVIRDMHDVIGDLSQVLNVLELLANRAITKPVGAGDRPAGSDPRATS